MRKILNISLFVLFAAACPAPATEVFLSISAHGNRMDIGISGFNPVNAKIEEAKLGRQITEVLRNDMLLSRYFNLVEGGTLFTGKDAELQDWQDKGANILVCGKLELKGRAMTVSCQLYDVYGKKIVWEKEFEGDIDDYRYIAHDMNDEIVLRFVGEKGIARSKIVFSNNSSGSKELYIVDYDGYNPRQITSDHSINILPKWSPDSKEIIFTTYRYGNPDLYSISPAGTAKRAVSKLQGLNTAGSFSPDSSKIALTLSSGNQSPNIFILDRSGKVLNQLTFGRAIATSPYFAPNGKEIVFICDKPGFPQLYITNIEGGNLRRLTTSGFCDSPCWSPRGDKIAFSMRVDDEHGYDIFLYDLNTSKAVRLTFNKGNDENPSFSADGRFLVFSSLKEGRKVLEIMAIDGSGVRTLVNIKGSCATPSWSR